MQRSGMYSSSVSEISSISTKTVLRIKKKPGWNLNLIAVRSLIKIVFAHSSISLLTVLTTLRLKSTQGTYVLEKTRPIIILLTNTRSIHLWGWLLWSTKLCTCIFSLFVYIYTYSTYIYISPYLPQMTWLPYFMCGDFLYILYAHCKKIRALSRKDRAKFSGIIPFPF